jgi:hypothetical protein
MMKVVNCKEAGDNKPTDGEYKGVYFNNDKEEQLFEWGAHFKYSELYRRLDKLISRAPTYRVCNDSSEIKGKNCIYLDSTITYETKVY